jgi:hypothetical protein
MAGELYETKAWARAAKGAPFAPITIKRNTAGDDDVTFELKYCGICHTDVHIANNDMGKKRRLNMELDLQSLFGVHTAQLDPPGPSIWDHIRGRYCQPR